VRPEGGTGFGAGQAVQVLSMPCNALFSLDWRRSPQWYLDAIHILAYVHRYAVRGGCQVDGSWSPLAWLT
jgi:hypothetical protein